jgi:4-amino-4-deoxy-L-arabinose transferase-like glycosyltransferase
VKDTSRTPLPLVLLWIACLAILSVGARNFELGLSTDGPLYAAIARRIADTGEWFRMYGGVPDFDPFAEHPHLGFWVLAVFFKILPAADWAARIPGHLFYVGFLLLFFNFVRKQSGERAAVVTVLLLWIWPAFSNWFSNAYLDPGALFFGLLSITLFAKALEKNAWSWSIGAGLALGFCALYKGLTVLGFGPGLAYLALAHSFKRDPINRMRNPQQAITQAGVVLAFWFGVMAIYSYAVSKSSVPDFLSIYFDRQWSGRFAQQSSFGGLVGGRFWWIFLKCTHFLLPLVFWPLLKGLGGVRVKLPFVLLVSFTIMFSTSGVFEKSGPNGSQYLLYLLPWVAWLIGQGVAETFEFPHDLLMYVTQRFAIVAVLVIQYLPLSTHKSEPPEMRKAATKLYKEGYRRLYVDVSAGNPAYVDFVGYSQYPWYTRLDVLYPAKSTVDGPPDTETLYYLVGRGQKRDQKRLMLEASGWCRNSEWDTGTLYAPCEVGHTSR